jgi:hypothetical protein
MYKVINFIIDYDTKTMEKSKYQREYLNKLNLST